MQLQLIPLDADPVSLGSERGVGLWAATTIDPAFIARVGEGGAPLDPGWYRASATLDRRGGEILDPRIYLPDAKGNFSEARTVELTREGTAYAAEFFLPNPVDHLRFDPSTARCEFACSGLEIAPIAQPVPRVAGAAAGDSHASLASSLLRVGRDAVRRLRPAPPASASSSARPAGRKARVLAGIDRNGFGLEIGPSHDPLAPKSEGYKVHVIDHASREELLVKYQPHNVPLDRIEEVDFVWRGQTYLELTGRPKYYD